ncbi:MAG: glycosyltransferase [Thermodesulfobacteriota bacterium]
MNTTNQIVNWFNYAVLAYFGVANLVYLFLLVVACVVVVRHMRRLKYGRYQEEMHSSLALPVTMIIAAYNEEKNIADTIKALLRLNYPDFEVIVVDDGSTDGTLARLQEVFELERADFVYRPIIQTSEVRAFYINPAIPKLTVVAKEHGGKADSLNAGVNISRSPYICSVDADSILEEKAITRLMRTVIEDPDTIMATGGIVKILNGCLVRGGRIEELRLPKDSLSRFQIVEYIRSFLFGRAGWSAVNALLIISGTFSVINKRALAAVGGYTKRTVTEDMDLILSLHKHFIEEKKRYKILFVPDPVCWTEAPQTFKMLARQRRRWHMGLMQSVLYHKKMLFNPKYSAVGLFAMPYQFIVELFGPVVEIAGYVVVTLCFFLGIVDGKFFVLFLTLAILIGVLLSTGAILLEEMTYMRYPRKKDFLTLLLYGVLENFGYRQINSLWRTQAVIMRLFGGKRWERVEKHGYKWKKG